jgi:intracellular multiplication protein IcmL
MASSEQSTQGKAAYYRDGFRILMRIVNVQAAVIFLLSIVLAAYLCTRTNQDRFIAEMANGKVMQMISLPSPNMGRIAMSEWVANAASQIMTFGFNNIDQRFALSRLNFTKDGWENFREAVVRSGFIDEMVKTQQIITTVPESPPILRQEGLVNGRYTWVFDVPLLMTSRAGADNVQRHKTAVITVERVSTRENPNGVGIAKWQMQ